MLPHHTISLQKHGSRRLSGLLEISRFFILKLLSEPVSDTVQTPLEFKIFSLTKDHNCAQYDLNPFHITKVIEKIDFLNHFGRTIFLRVIPTKGRCFVSSTNFSVRSKLSIDLLFKKIADVLYLNLDRNKRQIKNSKFR